ncbi:MAG: succinate dehydrogenase cytochrome b subunit [Prevotellaceae bacterium]|jgi:succinate dehydrogenase / fumarate reductase cytochrome b subunit|nr:succinate dehydrogenase cytochrome b subunit [Prevotellaceae bacterium]
MSNVFTSSIGKKLIMSITGAFLVLFLLFHMSMNVVAIISPSGYDAICAFLGSNWYALIGTLVLAGGFFLHILFALILTLYNRKARGNNGYATSVTPKTVSWASQNMFVLGLIVVLGVLLHLLQFWYNMQFAEIMGQEPKLVGIPEVSTTSGSTFIAYYFSNIIFVVGYLVWFAALWLHISHGFWSILQTTGFNNEIWISRLKIAAKIFASIIFLGFAAVVITFYLKSLCSGCC